MKCTAALQEHWPSPTNQRAHTHTPAYIHTAFAMVSCGVTDQNTESVCTFAQYNAGEVSQQGYLWELEVPKHISILKKTYALHMKRKTRVDPNRIHVNLRTCKNVTSRLYIEFSHISHKPCLIFTKDFLHHHNKMGCLIKEDQQKIHLCRLTS